MPKSESTVKKDKGGRPTAFKPEYCSAVVDYMGQGYSIMAFAGSIGVSRDTVYEWERTNTEFSDSIKRARAARVQNLEQRLLTGNLDAARVIFALKNACPDEWRDKTQIEHEGKIAVKKEDKDMTATECDQKAEELGLLELVHRRN